MKKIIFAVLMLFAVQANAGFLLGYAVGAAGNSGGGESVSPPVQVISSDHDTISCETRDGIGCSMNVCKTRAETTPGCRRAYCTVDGFVEYSGYTTLHKRSVALSGSYQYIVLEVSK